MKSTKRTSLPEAVMLTLTGLAALGGYNARAAYPDLILSDHPVAYYRLEETSGATAADSSGNGFDAVFSFNSTGTFPILGEPGIDTNSVLFNGGADFASVSIPYQPELSPTNSDGITGAPFSAECWAQATSDSLSDYTSPLAMSGAYTTSYPSGSGWNFYQTQGPGSGWALFIRGGAVYTFFGPPVTLLQWYHLAVTWDGAAATFYVNGVSQGSSAINYKAVDPLAGYAGAIGAGPQTGHGAFAGGVDEVAFYTNTLTAAQILDHYQLGTNSFRAPNTPPVFVSTPGPTTNYSGTRVTFSAVVNGTQPLHYQWKRNGTIVAGATDSSYSFICYYPADDQATFSITVTNSVGLTNSPLATLTVLTNLNIIADPYSITRNVGSAAAFRVAASGAVPIQYQWFKGTTAIAGQTSDTLWLTNLQSADDGSLFHAHVSNPFTSADTMDASLSVVARAVNVPLTGYAQIVAADHPVAYWRLDEPNGSVTAVDAVGSFDGTYDNSKGDITFGVPPGIPGFSNPSLASYDQAVDLSDTNTLAIGRGGVVRIPYALELNPFGPWSMEAWVRPDSNDTNNNFRSVMSSLYNYNFSAAVYGWVIYQHPNSGNGAWTLGLFNGTGGPGFFGSDFGHIPLIPGSWYHLVLTDDGTNIILYVNGVAGSARTTVAASGFIPNGINGDPTLSAGSEVLGQRGDGAFFGFSGAMDEVAFYNYALAPSQIAAHSQATPLLTITRTGASVVLAWPVGTLQSATAPGGPFSDLNQPSPYSPSTSGPPMYYRVRLPAQ